MILDIEQESGKLIISYYNSKGRVEFKKYSTAEMHNWTICRENDRNRDAVYSNWNGQAVKKYNGRFLNKYSIIEFLESLPEKDKEDLFANNYPKCYFIDIETEITDGFPDPKDALNKITAIAISTPNKQVIVLALKELDKEQQNKIQSNIDEHLSTLGEKFKFIYKSYNTEYDMLYTFINELMPNFPMMSGWNVVRFDWTYIVNRCRRLNIDPGNASPTGNLSMNDSIPMHVGIMDYLDIYKKWDRSIDIKENFTLDSAGEAVLGIRKIKYEGNLDDLYKKDYDKFIFYNAVDTILVQLIHEKLKTIEILLTISTICKSSIYKAAAPVALMESLMCRKFLETNKVLAKDFSQTGEAKDGQFAGAYVKAPIVGSHKGVACYDFASLYPSIMRQFNISPESFLNKFNSMDCEIYRKDKSKIVTDNGCVYDKEVSALKVILDDLYSKRKVYKKQSFQHELEADYIKQELKSRGIKI